MCYVIVVYSDILIIIKTIIIIKLKYKWKIIIYNINFYDIRKLYFKYITNSNIVCWIVKSGINCFC